MPGSANRYLCKILASRVTRVITSVNITRFDGFIHECPQILRASIRSRKDDRHDSNRRAQFQRGDEIPQNLSSIFFGPVMKDKRRKYMSAVTSCGSTQSCFMKMFGLRKLMVASFRTSTVSVILTLSYIMNFVFGLFGKGHSTGCQPDL